MAYYPTKILSYDLDANLEKLMDNLTEFQGTYGSLYERLTDLTSDTFSDEIQAVIDDLLNGYENKSVHVIPRIEAIRTQLEETNTSLTETKESIATQLEQLQKDMQASAQMSLLDGGTYQEAFVYDPDYGNVTKHSVTGDKEYTVTYFYQSLADGQLSHSVQTFLNKEGDTTDVTKTYTYDNQGNIITIQTSTKITPAIVDPA